MTTKKSDVEIIEETVKSLTSRPVRNDNAGLGHFGASRGSRVHKGVDYEAEMGEEVTSPAVGKVTKIGYPYADDLSYRYVQIEDRKGNRHRVFYVEPDSSLEVGSVVKAGQPIGKAQDIAGKHGGGMINHVHYEILDAGGRAVSQEEYNKKMMAGVDDGTPDAEVQS